ncbi:ABC transporter permease subunit [Jatrophihabitans sp.]|uniref:ABC transporter permease subunit n=1 Tax=Jatrophihabitans sp. TaxID=1932789 RepID=UPI002CE8DD5F|nr:hypothetical protein [Jatrophihabitans sp.]
MIAGVLLQVVLAGLAQGVVLGLVALGFSLVAGTARVLPFAHGDIVVGAAFLAVLAVAGRTPTAAPPGRLASVALLVFTLAAGAALSGLVGGLTVLSDGARQPGPESWIAGGLAAGLLLRAGLAFVLAQQAYALPDALHVDALAPGGLLRLPGGGTVPVRAVCVLAIGLAAGLATEAVLARSRFGAAVRAVADDPAGAALCGVPARRVMVAAFSLAGLLAGLAGLLATPGRAVSVGDGALLGLAAAAAAVLGGIGSPRGALAGGLLIGCLQALAGYAFGTGVADLLPLVLLVAVLAVRPPSGRGGRLTGRPMRRLPSGRSAAAAPR